MISHLSGNGKILIFKNFSIILNVSYLRVFEMLKVSRSKIPLTLSGLNLIWNTFINFFFSEKFSNRIEYPNFFKFKKKFFSNIFDLSILNLSSLFFLYLCQIPIFFLYKKCQGKYSPGSFFLNGAISECPKIFLFLIE